jgi:hypothetical protein
MYKVIVCDWLNAIHVISDETGMVISRDCGPCLLTMKVKIRKRKEYCYKYDLLSPYLNC